MADNLPMERAWERAHSFVELTEAELERCVRTAFPGAVVVQAERLEGGLRNSNYVLSLAGAPSPLVLRIYVAGSDACGREAVVLQTVAGRVPAPSVWRSEPAAVPPFALLGWLEGRAMDEVLAEADAATAVELATLCGTALAAIHEIRFRAAGFLGPGLRVARAMPAWAPTVLSTLAGPAGERLGRELAARVRCVAESDARSVEPVWSEAVLVHGDFKPWNLLVRRARGGAGHGDTRGGAGDRDAWQVSGVLDWEFACAGSRLIDFATFLRDEASRPTGFGDAFAAAYVAAGGTVPADWRRLTRLIDLLNLLQMLEWSEAKGMEDLRRLTSDTLDSID